AASAAPRSISNLRGNPSTANRSSAASGGNTALHDAQNGPLPPSFSHDQQITFSPCAEASSRSLELDALAAAAGPLDVGVLELEAAADHRGCVPERRAVQVEVALRVDEHPHGALLERQDLVLRARLAVRPFEEVRKPGAAAAADADAQPLGRRRPLRGRLLDLGDRSVCHANGHLSPQLAAASSRGFASALAARLAL